MEQPTNTDISFSWKLVAGDKNDDEYIKIMRAYREYGYKTMTKLVAAAVKEYAENHPLEENHPLDDAADYKYNDIL